MCNSAGSPRVMAKTSTELHMQDLTPASSDGESLAGVAHARPDPGLHVRSAGGRPSRNSQSSSGAVAVEPLDGARHASLPKAEAPNGRAGWGSERRRACHRGERRRACRCGTGRGQGGFTCRCRSTLRERNSHVLQKPHAHHSAGEPGPGPACQRDPLRQERPTRSAGPKRRRQEYDPNHPLTTTRPKHRRTRTRTPPRPAR